MRPRGFTLLETVLAIAILGMLSAALYAVCDAALDATHATIENQASEERLDAFLRASRNAFAALPAEAEVILRYDAGTSAGSPEVVFRGRGTYFGMPVFGGGEVILGAPAMADGTRTFTIWHLPPGATAEQRSARGPRGGGLRLFPRVERVTWDFYSQGEWKREWPEGAGRPQLVRLRFEQRDEAEGAIHSVFWLPPLAASPAAEAPPAEEPPPPPEIP